MTRDSPFVVSVKLRSTFTLSGNAVVPIPPPVTFVARVVFTPVTCEPALIARMPAPGFVPELIDTDSLTLLFTLVSALAVTVPTFTLPVVDETLTLAASQKKAFGQVVDVAEMLVALRSVSEPIETLALRKPIVDVAFAVTL